MIFKEDDMIKFILFTLIVFTFLISTHNTYGQQVIIENTTANISSQDNKPSSDETKTSAINRKKRTMDIYFINIYNCYSNNYCLLVI